MATAHSKLTKVPTTTTDKDFFTGVWGYKLDSDNGLSNPPAPVLFLRTKF